MSRRRQTTKARAVFFLQRHFNLRTYTFVSQKQHWLIGIRGNVVVLTTNTEEVLASFPSLLDIRKLGNERDYALFVALTGLGTRQSMDYRLVAEGRIDTLLKQYNHAIFARSNQHVFSTSWRKLALAHSTFFRRNHYSLPCAQISEDINAGRLLVSLNYPYVGTTYFFVAGIPVEYAYPFYEPCSPMRLKSEGSDKRRSSVIPWLRKLETAQIRPIPTPPLTLQDLENVQNPALTNPANGDTVEV